MAEVNITPSLPRPRKPARYIPSAVFNGVTVADAEDALMKMERGEACKFPDSFRYDVLWKTKRFPAKAVLGAAAEKYVGRKLVPADFTAQTSFKVLRRLGFTIVPKLAEESPVVSQRPVGASENYFAPAPTGRAIRSNGSPKRSAAKRDYAARDSQNRGLGRAGEEFVVSLEKLRLTESGRPDLAENIHWVADIEGDGLGYDIRSFDAQTGTSLLIEVKTTNGPRNASFFVTEREIETSIINRASYRLYRVWDFQRSPRVYVLRGPLTEFLELVPKVYLATVR